MIAGRVFMLVGFGSAVLSASCALVFTDYPADEGGSGGAGESVIETSSSSTMSSTMGGQGGQTPVCVRPVLAIDHIFVGDRSYPDGTALPYAWRQYGIDIDNLETSTDFTGHCTPNSNASPFQAFLDGEHGIDNSFGHNLLPLFAGLSDDVNSNIDSGNIGYLFDIVDFGADPITTRFYSGAQLGHDPSFGETDCWQVDGATVTDPDDVATAKVVFPDGAAVGDIWQSGLGTLALVVKYQGKAVPLTIHHALVQAQLTPEHDATEADGIGLITGVLDTEEFVAAVSRYIHDWMPDECENLADLPTAIRQASDIMTDGTQDPGAQCNGISIGLGFTAKRFLLGAVAPASSLPDVPCAWP